MLTGEPVGTKLHFTEYVDQISDSTGILHTMNVKLGEQLILTNGY